MGLKASQFEMAPVVERRGPWGVLGEASVRVEIAQCTWRLSPVEFSAIFFLASGSFTTSR